MDEDVLRETAHKIGSALVVETSSGNTAALQGGSIVVSIDNMQSSDVFAIAETSGITMDGDTSPATIKYDDGSSSSVTLGTISGGRDGTGLVIALADTVDVTAESVTALLQALTYQSDTYTPVVDSRELRVQVISEDNTLSSQADSITITAVNDAPELEGTPPEETIEGGEALFAGASLVIEDNDGYDGLQLLLTTDNPYDAQFSVNNDSDASTGVSYNAETGEIRYKDVVVATIEIALFLGSVTPTYTDANLINVVSNGGTLTASGSDWDQAGSFSSEGIIGDGRVSAKSGDNKTLGKVFGLSSDNTNNHYDSIDYGLYFTKESGGTLYVTESGERLFTGTYTLHDVFSIERNGDTITYLKNGEVFYTSEVPATGTLFLDTAFIDTDGSFDDVTIENKNDASITFNEHADKVAVEAVAKAVSYQGPEQDITLTVRDGDGAISEDSLTVKAGGNQAPELSVSALSFDGGTLKASAQYIASDIDIIDPESDYLNLLVKIEVAEADGTGSLTLNADNGVTIVGNYVSYNDNVVAQLTDAGSDNSLSLKFNNNASKASVDAVVAQLQYQSKEDISEDTDKTITYTVTDGAGEIAAPVSQIISITAELSDWVLVGSIADQSLAENDLQSAAVNIGTDLEIRGVAETTNLQSAQILVALANGLTSDIFAFDSNIVTVVDDAGVLTMSLTADRSVVLGTIDSINNGNGQNLFITLADDVTAAHVETLLQALTYQSTTDAPVTDSRDLTVSITEESSNVSFNQQASITITAENDAPVLTGTSPTGTIAAGEALFADASLVIEDNDGYDGLQLLLTTDNPAYAQFSVNDSDTDDASTGVSYNAETGEIRYDDVVVATIATRLPIVKNGEVFYDLSMPSLRLSS